MDDNAPDVFYSSKPKLVHMALNITLAPILLYLVGLWPWPPTLPHYITFAITGLIGMRYAKLRWDKPRLVIDDDGIYYGDFYPWSAIRQMQTVMRAVRLTLMTETGEIKQRLINLGWASNDDFKKILAVIDRRYQERSKS